MDLTCLLLLMPTSKKIADTVKAAVLKCFSPPQLHVVEDSCDGAHKKLLQECTDDADVELLNESAKVQSTASTGTEVLLPKGDSGLLLQNCVEEKDVPGIAEISSTLELLIDGPNPPELEQSDDTSNGLSLMSLEVTNDGTLAIKGAPLQYFPIRV